MPQAASYEQIYQVVALIPPGQVATYGQVADLAGLPRRARLVGTALRHCPAERQLPWHRVVRASGQLAFSPGSAQAIEQRTRLQQEGVIFSHWRVALSRYQWQPSLAEMLHALTH